MKLINNHTWGRQKLTSVFAHFLLENKTQTSWDFLYPICISLLLITLSLCFFFNFKIFSMFYFGWLLIFSLFFMTADCISFVWVHLAFFFLSVQVKIKIKKSKTYKKKSLHELERPARTFYNDLFSLLMSRLKKQKGPVVLADCSCRWKEENISQLLRINTQSGLGSASKKNPKHNSTPFFHRDLQLLSVPPSTRWRLWSSQYMDFHPLPAWFL